MKGMFSEMVAVSLPALQNPMLSAIADAARSPNEADEYVTRVLGWSGNLGKLMRQTVSLRDHFRANWDEVRKVRTRPLDAIYQLERYSDDGKDSVWVASWKNMACDAVDRLGWELPFMLREFINGGLGRFSTFDGKGDISIWDWEEGSINMDRWPWHVDKPIASIVRPSLLNNRGMAIRPCGDMDQRDKQVDEICGTEKMLIWTGVVVRKASATQTFPEFWKYLEIRRGNGYSQGDDVVTVWVRCDINYKAHHVKDAAMLRYERYIPCKPKDPHLNHLCISAAVLAKDYSLAVWEDWRACGHLSDATISRGAMGLKGVNEKDIRPYEEVVRELIPLQIELDERQVFPTGKLLGEALLTGPSVPLFEYLQEKYVPER